MNQSLLWEKESLLKDFLIKIVVNKIKEIKDIIS